MRANRAWVPDSTWRHPRYKNHRRLEREEALRVRDEPLHPGELVTEFRPGLRIAVGRIERGDENAADGGLQIPALRIVGIAGQSIARRMRLRPREDRDAIVGALSHRDRVIARALQ